MAERVQLISSMPGLDDARSIAEFMFKQQMFQAEQARAAEQMRLQREQMDYERKMAALRMKAQEEDRRMQMDLAKQKMQVESELLRQRGQMQSDLLKQKAMKEQQESSALRRFGEEYGAIQQGAQQEQEMMRQAAPQIGQTVEQLLAMSAGLGGGAGMAGTVAGMTPGQGITEDIQQNFPQRNTQAETMAALLRSGLPPQTIDDVSRAIGAGKTGGEAGEQRVRGTQLLGRDPLTGHMAYINSETGAWESKAIPGTTAPKVEPEVLEELEKRGLPPTLANVERTRKEMSSAAAKETERTTVRNTRMATKVLDNTMKWQDKYKEAKDKLSQSLNTVADAQPLVDKLSRVGAKGLTEQEKENLGEMWIRLNYDYSKALDRDSAVREPEYQRMKTVMSTWDKWASDFRQLRNTQGAAMKPETWKAMFNAINSMNNVIDSGWQAYIEGTKARVSKYLPDEYLPEFGVSIEGWDQPASATPAVTAPASTAKILRRGTL